MDQVGFEKTGPGRFRVTGRLQFDTVSQALTASESLFAEPGDVAVDLGAVEATDRAGLALLMELAGRAHRERRRLSYRHIPQQVISLAKISEVDALLPRS